MTIHEKCNDELKDPIGIDTVIGILSLSLSAVSVILQYKQLKNSHIEAESFKVAIPKLKEQLLKLADIINKLVQILHSVSMQNDVNFHDKSISIKDTLLMLSQDDYDNWIRINDIINDIRSEIYAILSDLRRLALQYRTEPDKSFEETLFSEIDKLLLGMSNMNFGDFIDGLRKNVLVLIGITEELSVQ